MNLKKGWAQTSLMKKPHYFVNGTSLCGKWMFCGEVEEGNPNWSDCIICANKFNKLYGDVYPDLDSSCGP
jgi:hypothetical protein